MRPVEVRFWSKVDKRGPDECWPWMASLRLGYGQFYRDGRPRNAHRTAYELQVGPIPEGLTIDHLCRNRACQNARHLEPVTNEENIRRGTFFGSGTAAILARTHCKHGHAFDEQNTQHAKWGRRCRACNRGYARRYYAEKAA